MRRDSKGDWADRFNQFLKDNPSMTMQEAGEDTDQYFSDKALDRQYQHGFRAGWNAGVTGDEKALKQISNRDKQ